MKLVMMIGLAIFTSVGLWTSVNGKKPTGKELTNKVAIIEKNESIDFSSFKKLTNNIEHYRSQRRISVEDFLKMSKEENTIILDTRSADAFRKMHVKGAVHLNFSDFTKDNLASVIPSKDTRVLIYCNNNFRFGPSSLASKLPPLALNIPTFINLFGYGYEDIYELGPLLPVDDTVLEFEGDEIKIPGYFKPLFLNKNTSVKLN